MNTFKIMESKLKKTILFQLWTEIYWILFFQMILVHYLSFGGSTALLHKVMESADSWFLSIVTCQEQKDYSFCVQVCRDDRWVFVAAVLSHPFPVLESLQEVYVAWLK